jgi:hypothetical protein
MKKLGFLLFLGLVLCKGIFAQANANFIFLQTANNEPFFVTINKKSYSSTSYGYLVLSNITSNSLQFSLGYLRNDKTYNFRVDNITKDRGFVVKNMGSQLSLFDWQSTDLINANEPTTPSNTAKTEELEKADDFTELLTDATGDKTIKENAIKNKKAEAEKAQAEADRIANEKKQKEEAKLAQEKLKEEERLRKAEEKEQKRLEAERKRNEQNASTPSPSDLIVVSKYSASNITVTNAVNKKTEEGVNQVYIVTQPDGTNDTIRLLIPASFTPTDVETKTPTPAPPVKTIEEEPKKEVTIPTVKPEDKTVEKEKVPLVTNPTPKTAEPAKETWTGWEENVKEDNKKEAEQSTKPPKQEEPPAEAKPKPMVNSNCRSLATEGDFLKLRKRIAGENDEDGMVTIAKKEFKRNCYSVEQLKNLSYLFLSNTGKYALFDAAYPFTSDTHNFPQLKNLLTDEYFIGRFNAMIKR